MLIVLCLLAADWFLVSMETRLDVSDLLLCVQLWVEERLPLATSTDHGHNLQTVQLLIKKNQVTFDLSPGNV